jgi:uncharacterized protein YbjT (DUF2867 family)
MNITIFGASGRTGRHLVEQALEKGHRVTAYVRREKAIDITHENLRVVIGSITDPAKLKEAIQGKEACLSVMGGSSLTRHAEEIKAGIDLIVRIMEEEGVPRLIYLSSAGAGESRYSLPQPVRFLVCDIMLRIPLADHFSNEQRIAKSRLAWTVVRPGGLTDGPLTGKLAHGSGKSTMKGMMQISRANVASFMLDQLSGSEYHNKAVWIREIP